MTKFAIMKYLCNGMEEYPIMTNYCEEKKNLKMNLSISSQFPRQKVRKKIFDKFCPPSPPPPSFSLRPTITSLATPSHTPHRPAASETLLKIHRGTASGESRNIVSNAPLNHYKLSIRNMETLFQSLSDVILHCC